MKNDDVFFCKFINEKNSFAFFVCVHRADIKAEDKSLIIHNVVPVDEGIYICEAQNTIGQISARAQLVVNCK